MKIGVNWVYKSICLDLCQRFPVFETRMIVLTMAKEENIHAYFLGCLLCFCLPAAAPHRMSDEARPAGLAGKVVGRNANQPNRLEIS